MANHDRVGRLFEQVSTNQNRFRLREGFTLEFEDDQFAVIGEADNTKRLVFSLGNVPTATTKTVTPGESVPVTTTAASVAVAASDSGTTYHATASSGTQTFTLPAAGAGLRYTFICGHASGEILITPASGDAINIMTFSAVGADADTARVAPAAGTGIKNTAATNVVGDTCVLEAVDTTTWYGIGVTAGIWASQ